MIEQYIERTIKQTREWTNNLSIDWLMIENHNTIVREQQKETDRETLNDT